MLIAKEKEKGKGERGKGKRKERKGKKESHLRNFPDFRDKKDLT